MATREKRDGKPSHEVAGAVPGQLEALRELAGEKRPDLIPLDLTYESLDRVEDLFRDIIEGKVSGATVDSTEPLVATYLGQTLIDRAGGKWGVGGARDEFPGRLCVTDLPDLGRFRFFPHQTVKAFRLYGAAGHLRDETEPYDLVRLRERAARDLRERESEIDALRADVGELIGAPAALDFTLDSLGQLTRAIRRVSGRDAWRRMRTRAALYIGETARRLAGHGEWALCEDPVNAHYGHLRIGEWSPTWSVYGASEPGDDDRLRRSVDAAVKGLSR
jgi:hypothetical protein